MHTAVFPIVHLSIHNGITKVPDIRVGGDGAVFLLVQFLQLVGLDLRLQKLDGFGKQL